MGGRAFDSASMKMGKKSCAEFVPLGVTTVTYVRLQAAIEKYCYQNIGTTSKNSVTPLMRKSNEM